MKEKLENLRLWLAERKFLLLFGVFAWSVILIIIAALLTLFQRKPTPKVPSSPTPSSVRKEVSYPLSPLPTRPVQSLSPPKVFFETYENKAPLPSLPETIKTYTFKTDFSLEEILSLGQKLGLNQKKGS